MDLLIFDFDGLILDTESAGFQAWTEIFASYGATLPLDTWVQCVGTSNDVFNVYEYLESTTGLKLDHMELRKRHNRRSLELIEPMVPRPGVLDYLNEARNQRIALAVASSSPQEWVVGHLSRLGLADRFHSIRCANDVKTVKPDPELYQVTLEFMGVSADRAIAFEDSPNGVRAAKAAGIYCVAVPNSITRGQPLHLADHRIESMSEISLKDLIHLSRNRPAQV